MLELVVTRGSDELISLPLDRQRFRIGRSTSADLSIPDPTVSRNQCDLIVEGAKVRLRDQSGKGTRVDGQICEECTLAPGAQLEFGALRVRLQERPEEHLPQVTASLGGTDLMPSETASVPGLLLSGRIGDRRIRVTLKGAVITLGSDPGNDLVLEDQFVSSFHCRLYRQDDAWYVRDLDSTNGTRINGVAVTEARLEAGSRLSLGGLHLQVQSTARTAEAPIGFEGILSADPAFEAVFDRIRRAAPTDETVLITGESGTGKELVARALHRLSKRAQGKLVPLNCSAITKDLMESELFGHEKGAFTGAQSRRQGLFEEAQGGTLFLDEIGELPLDLQAKLLRALESGEIRPVGSNTARQVDTRVVAATHRSLPERVQDGEFREDLFYRLNVIQIALPPLRKRPADIQLLAEHFLSACTDPADDRSLSDEALAHLSNYGFPGNVRELKNTITRAAIMCPDRVISPEHLTFQPATLADRVAEGQVYQPGKTLREIEIEAVRGVLAANKFNQKAAARALGIARSTLISKMEKYGILAE